MKRKMSELISKDSRIMVGMDLIQDYLSWTLEEIQKKDPDMKWVKEEIKLMQKDLSKVKRLFIQYRKTHLKNL